MRIKANDSAIRNHLGIDGRKADPAKNTSSNMLTSDKNQGSNVDARFSNDFSRSEDGLLLDPCEFTKSVLEDCNAI